MTVSELYDQIGGDYTDLKSRIMKEELIAGFLHKYIEDPSFNRMVEAFESKDYRGVFESSHNLKGMAANLSLKKNQATVSEICEAVRNGDPEIDLSPLMERAKEEHSALIGALSRLN